MPVLDAQHLLAVGLVAAALAPQVRRLDGRHQKLDRAGAVLLLAHDPADLVEHPQAERQEGVNACGLLPHHAGAQHQPVRDDFRLAGRFAQDRQEIAGQTHCATQKRWRRERRVKPERSRKHKSRQSLRVASAASLWRHGRMARGGCSRVSPVSVVRETVASFAYGFLGGNKVASCSVMTTDSSSVRVPPRKGERPVGRTATLTCGPSLGREKAWRRDHPLPLPGHNNQAGRVGLVTLRD